MKTPEDKLLAAKRNARRAFSFLNKKPANYKLAIEYFQLAHNQGNISATYNLGILYKTAPTKFRNHFNAYKYLNQAAKAKYHKAYRVLASMYAKNKGVGNSNDSLALYWFTQAAQQGDPVAQLEIARWYKDRYELDKVIEWLKRLQDTQHQAEACRLMGEINETLQQQEEAKKNYTHAHNLGDMQASCHLGRIAFRQGQYKQAKKYFKKPATLNHAEACDYLAQIYDKKKNSKKALLLYKRAAFLGLAKSKLNLSHFHVSIAESAIHRARSSLSNKLSFYWCYSAAISGYTKACLPLSKMYRYGNGTKKNLQLFLQWALKAAVADDCQALELLQESLVNQSPKIKKALKKWKIEALHGNINKLYWLGVMYQHGFLVKQNHSCAIYYYKQAAAKNYSAAIKNLEYYRLPNSPHKRIKTSELLKNIEKAGIYFQTEIMLGDKKALNYKINNRTCFKYLEYIHELIIRYDKNPPYNDIKDSAGLEKHLKYIAKREKVPGLIYALARCYEEQYYFCRRPADRKKALALYQAAAEIEIPELAHAAAYYKQNISSAEAIKYFKQYLKFKRCVREKQKTFANIEIIEFKKNSLSMSEDLMQFQLKAQQEEFFYHSIHRLDLSEENISAMLSAYADKQLEWMISQAKILNDARIGNHVAYYSVHDNERGTPAAAHPFKNEYIGKYDPISILLYQAAAIELHLPALHALIEAYNHKDARRPTEQELAILTYQAVAAHAYDIILWISCIYYQDKFHNIKKNLILAKELNLLIAKKKTKDDLTGKAKLNHEIIAFDLENNDSYDIKKYHKWLAQATKMSSAETLNILNLMLRKLCSNCWPEDKNLTSKLELIDKKQFGEALSMYQAKENAAVQLIQKYPGLKGAHFFQSPNTNTPSKQPTISTDAVKIKLPFTTDPDTDSDDELKQINKRI